MLTTTQWLFVLPLGALISMLGSLVGLGGGVLMVPLLVLVFGIPLKIAIAVVTFCLFPAALLSTYLNARARHIDYFAGIALEIPTLLGAVLGAMLTNVLPVRPMEGLFAGLIAVMGWRILNGKSDPHKKTFMDRLNEIPPILKRDVAGSSYRAGIPAIGFFGLLSGTLAGLFGIGGGIIKTPVMLKVFRMPARKATATSLFMIVFTSSTAAYSHWQMGRMNWSLATPLAGAFFIGSFVGNKLAGRVPANMIEKILGIVLLCAALAIAVHAVWLTPH